MQRHAEAAAFATPRRRRSKIVPHVKQVVAKPKLTAREDERLGPERQRPLGRRRGRGRQAAIGRVPRRAAPRTRNGTDYATTVVMYRPAYRGDALRLAHVLGVKVVGPLDGLAPAALHGAQLVILLGAR